MKRAYGFVRIKRPAADQSAGLEVSWVDTVAEQVASVTPPRDALPVHRQRLVATGEAVGVVEQAPRDETAGDDGASSLRGGFRAAGLRVLGHLRGPKLADAAAPCIPCQVNSRSLASASI